MNANEREIFINRFLSNLPKEHINECWNWKGTINSNGYGVLSEYGRKGKKRYAHRVSWEFHNKRSIPSVDGYHGSVIMHTCDNRKCVNPKHLVLGTQSENVRDMVKKGRKVTVCIEGSKHHNASITEEIAQGIFIMKGLYKDIATHYKCSVAVVKGVKNRNTWRHATKGIL